MFPVFLFTCGFFIVIIMLNYFRAHRMILRQSQAVFPAHPLQIRTETGKVQPLHFKSKDWRIKRGTTIFSLALILVTLGAVTLGNAEVTLNMFFLTAFYPALTLINMKVPSFFITDEGLYLDEKFIPWEEVTAVKFSSVKLGNSAYGMFEDSSAYTEAAFNLEAGVDKKAHVYIYDTEEVEKMSSILRRFHIAVISSSAHSEKLNTKNSLS